MSSYSQSIAPMIVKTFNKMFLERPPVIQNIQKLSLSQISPITRLGENIEFIQSPVIQATKYAPPLVPVDLVPNTVMMAIDQALAFSFRVDNLRAKQWNALADDKAQELIAGTVKTGIDNWNYQIEESMAALAPLAGHKLNGDPVFNPGGNFTTPIELNYTSIFNIIQNMRAMMGRGVLEGGTRRTCFKEGKMALFLPYEVAALIPASQREQYTSEGFDMTKLGYVTHIAGFDIYESNVLQADALGNFTLFGGVKGETIGLIKQQEMEMVEIKDPYSLGSIYNAGGLFGSGMIRPEYACATYGNVVYS